VEAHLEHHPPRPVPDIVPSARSQMDQQRTMLLLLLFFFTSFLLCFFFCLILLFVIEIFSH